MCVPDIVGYESSDMNADSAETLSSRAYSQLRRAIIAAEIPPLARLQTRQLCTRLQMGLSPIREALSRLSSEGLVHRHDQRGFTVAPLDAAALDELTRTRTWLNETGLRESIAHGGVAWEEQLVAAFHRLSRLERSDADGTRNSAWETAHRHFHECLVGGCRSDWLIRYCDQLFDAFERYRSLSPFGSSARPGHLNEHRAIMAAALAHDADTAARLLGQHFALSAKLVHPHLPTQLPARPAMRRGAATMKDTSDVS
jgi:GntR family carbon starvation induced transcriptional regulator